jgi:hypothetical protein
MLMPALIGLAIGGVLARRFRVAALAPVILLILFLAITTGLARPDAAHSIGSTTVALIVCLQLGYLFGLGIRPLRVIARANRVRGNHGHRGAKAPAR